MRTNLCHCLKCHSALEWVCQLTDNDCWGSVSFSYSFSCNLVRRVGDLGAAGEVCCPVTTLLLATVVRDGESARFLGALILLQSWDVSGIWSRHGEAGRGQSWE